MRILAVAGSSGGHIFPAVTFLESLKKNKAGIEALLVIPERSAKMHITSADFLVRYIAIVPVNLSFKRGNLIALFCFFKGAWQSLKLLFDFKPDCVVGFGGIETIPLSLFAWLFRLKTLIHEQNVLPGKANRLLAKFCDKVAVSFNETKDYLKINKERIVLTGNPAPGRLKRVDKKQALEYFGLSENKITVLVTGGSLGSRSINSAFFAALISMNDNYKLQVIHITGEDDFAYLSKRYKDLNANVNSRLFTFLKDMQYAYSASDMAVTRAGATTIAELLFFRLPSVIIPYPYAYEHQGKNARAISNLGASVVIEDNKSLAEELKKALDGFINIPEKIKSMKSNLDNYNTENNPADLLIKAALE